jgi:hypothetical protein
MAVGATAMVAAVVKVTSAAITTDEAWSFNDWSSRDFATIFGDYHAPNNHVLHTALVRMSFLLLGPSEPALRVPALCGFALVIVATGLLARDTLRSPALRLAALAGVAFHPFVVDFGACARGYSLGLGFGLLALWALGRAARDTRASTGWGIAAGLAGGLSVGTVLAFANLVLAAAVAAFVGVWAGGVRRRASSLGAFAVSALAVLAPTYARLLEQIGAAHFRFGASDARTGFASLLQLIVYTPQSLVDAAGQPLVAGPIHSWRPNALLDAIDALLTTPAAEVALALLIAASVWTAWQRRRADPADAAALPGLTLGAFLAIVTVQGVLLAVPWPFHRTWLAAVPLLVLAATAAAERWLDRQPAPLRRRRALGLGALWIVWLVLGCARFDPRIYREWPDNAVVREALAEVARRREPGEPVELGHAWYLDACLRYYRTRDGLDWLRLADRPTAAEVPGPPFILASRRMRPEGYGGYAAAVRWGALGMTLLQRTDVP